MPSEDLRLLLSAIQTLAMLQGKIEDQDITLAKLRKLLGMVASSEKKDSSNTYKKNKKVTTKKDKNQSKKTNHPTGTHKIQHLKKGDECPKCPTEKKRTTL